MILRKMNLFRFFPVRFLSVVVCLAFISACAPVIAPPGQQPSEPRLNGEVFVTSDGLSLPVRRWLPDQPPKAVVLALHGFNDYAKAFDKIPANTLGTGPFLASQGFVVYAYDQRGFGRAPNVGLWPGEAALIGDFRDFARVLRRAHPNIPVYALGESMGGAVIMAAVADAQLPLVDGIVLAAPAVWARSTMPFYYRVALWLGARLAPGLKPSGRSLGRQASDNIDLLRDNARDPLFIKNTRLDAIYGISNLMDAALESAPKLDIPTLYLYGQNDQIIPKAPTLQAVKAFPNQGDQLRLIYYPKGWHIVLRDKQAQTVLGDVAAFLDAPKGALPSGADKDALARMSAALASE
ncbi:MAG: alpha/beta hydrolase [Rhodospirillaceae bacterium]|nr:alpha/beta hydrolase [Rhodospirillaceae bacterium]